MQPRQCVILKGTLEWCHYSSQKLLSRFDKRKTILFSPYKNDDFITFPQKQAQRYLGKEFDAVIFDSLNEFNPDSLGAIIGTIKQGGALILWIDTFNPSNSMQRFMRIITEFEQQHKQFTIIQQDQQILELTAPKITTDHTGFRATEEQQQAIKAILKVVYGHRRRPLVLTANRGRGKSASLGLAAAQLIKEGKQTILVTAPSLTTVDAVFEHAHQVLKDADRTAGLISVNKAQIRFIAPDILIASDFKADLILVDEAAAIPASMLEKLLQKYSRIVFSTTEHGYEGTGRGFTVRFQKTLDAKTPNWHRYQMNAPIRWPKNDPLEAFSFESLLLNAVPVEDHLISHATGEDCLFEYVDRHALIHNERDLRELFGLMVLAHYRTRPSDLQMMLDCDDVSVYVMRYQDHIVASVWLVNEGKLDDDLSQKIYEGQRRLKGHLLPQSLLAHVGIMSAGSLSYQRIIRITVHPAVQQCGIGKQLLTQIVEQAGCDLIGTSFAVSNHLLAFWLSSHFNAVRLGLHHDEVTGRHALMMLKPISTAGKNICNAAIQRFQKHWPHLLRHEFKQLDAELIITICQAMTQNNEVNLSQWEQQDIEAFSYAQRGFDFSQYSLWLWLVGKISQPEFKQLTTQQQQLCVMAILQQRDWAVIAQCLGFTGKSECINALREATALLLRTNLNSG